MLQGKRPLPVVVFVVVVIKRSSSLCTSNLVTHSVRYQLAAARVKVGIDNIFMSTNVKKIIHPACGKVGNKSIVFPEEEKSDYELIILLLGPK